MNVGGTNLFQVDIMTTDLPIACKPFPIPLKYQKFVNKEIGLLEDAGCISKSLSLWEAPLIIFPKCRPLKSSETTVSLSLRLPDNQYSTQWQ